MPCAVTALARGEIFTACSEESALGSEGRAWGERRKEFLRMPGQNLRRLCINKGKEIQEYLWAVGLVRRYAWLERPGSCLALVRSNQ